MSGVLKQKKLLKDINFFEKALRLNPAFSLKRLKNIKIQLWNQISNIMNAYNDENNEDNRHIYRKPYELPPQEEDLDHYMFDYSIDFQA